MLTTILLLLAVVCFFLAAFDVKLGASPPRVNLVALGLFLWALTLLLGRSL